MVYIELGLGVVGDMSERLHVGLVWVALRLDKHFVRY